MHELLKAWTQESSRVDEKMFTSFAKPGWTSWNGMSPEAEFAEFAAMLVRMLQPQVVLETGIGQGYVTRRLAKALPQSSQLLCFESDPILRRELKSIPFFAKNSQAVLAERLTPSVSEIQSAQLTVLDSARELRRSEIQSWHLHAKQPSLLLVHDTGNGHAPTTTHASLAHFIRQKKVEGIFLKNPRGCFLGMKR